MLDEPKRRQIARMIAALIIVFVPTAWSVIPGWAKWDGRIRLLVMAGWLLAALVVVVTTDRQNRLLGHLIGDVGESVRLRRRAAGLKAIQNLVENPPATFRGTRMSVYVVDHAAKCVRRIVDSEPQEPAHDFEFNQGATGYAFQRNEQVIARGDTVHDGSYGLSAVMCQDYMKYNLLVCTPMWNERNQPIGILSALALRDDPQLTSDIALGAHLQPATLVGQLGIDLLRWGLPEA